MVDFFFRNFTRFVVINGKKIYIKTRIDGEKVGVVLILLIPSSSRDKKRMPFNSLYF